MRKNIVAGNWKMNLTRSDGLNLVEEVLLKLPQKKKAEVVFAPSFLHLYKIAKICHDYDGISVAAQNCNKECIGAFTGEVSAAMIASCGADYVIIGHSERRENFNETNQELAQKVKQSLNNNLKIIFCCGESLKKREEGVHFSWIEQQISDSLFQFSAQQLKNIVIAYEPIWAIGTGKTASAEQAQEMHIFIRSILNKKYGNKVAEGTSILYGGSCNKMNARQLFAKNDIDGGLIGGASLSAKEFLKIIKSV